ncbi:MAG: FliH/SctL family protein [Oscillospiraceae bacterium]|nr:FliH/SctL family protein [Oscillospiraceae bacterium]
MSKVIKAGFVRVLEIEKKPVEAAPADDDDVSSAEETPVVAVAAADDGALSEKRELAERRAYQAAYDELVIAAQDEVSAMLADARNEALALMREAEQSVNELRDHAWNEGFSNGAVQAREQIEEMIGKINGEAADAERRFTGERERLLAGLETQMLGIAMDVAGKILYKELSDDDGAYISMLKEAVSRMPAEDVVTIRLNPEEYTRFFDKKSVKLQTNKGHVDAKLISDPTLNRFDAVIESPSGIIDAGADTQMAQMKRNMGL